MKAYAAQLYMKCSQPSSQEKKAKTIQAKPKPELFDANSKIQE